MREFMSGGMQKIASVAQSVFGGVDRRLATTQGKFNATGRSVTDLNNRISLLTQKRDLAIGTGDITRANREIRALEMRVERMQNRGLNQAGGGGGLRMPSWLSAAVIGGGLLAGGMYVAKAAANAQRDIIGLTTFVGEKQAKNIYSQLQQDAAATPFNTSSLLMVDRALISAGVNADKARLDMLGLANAISATGGGDAELSRMATNMQQIRNQGKATAMDVRQFAIAGINIYQILADATHKTVKQTKDMTVTYDLLSFALRKAMNTGGLYAGAMDRQSASIYGKWSTLLDNVEIAAAKIGLAQSGAITGLIDQLIAFTDRLPALAAQYAGTITNIAHHIISFVNTLMDMAKWLYHNWSWIKYVIGVFYTFKAAIWAATTAAGIYNSIMTLTAIRVAAVAAAEAEATAGALALDAAMAATPWGAIALGVAAVGTAIVALVSQSKNAGKEITSNLTPPNITKVVAPTMEDYQAGTAHMKTWGGYEWNTDDIMNSPFSAAEQRKYDSIVKRGAFEWVYKNEAITAIRNDREKSAAAIRAQMVVYTPPQAGMAAAAKGAKGVAADASGAYEGETTNTVTGGGRKQIIINIKSFAEHFIVNAGNLQDAAGQSREHFERMLLEVLASANSAL